MPTFPCHFQHSVSIPAEADTLFEYLDDPKRLGAHMGKSSWMMAGSKMKYQFDDTNGRSQGAKIRLSGKILGITLNVEELVTQHEPPFRKTWTTVGTPRLLIIGNYEMGFVIELHPTSCLLRVYIDYELPEGFWRLASWLLGGLYARWCVRSMATDAARHFTASSI